MGMAGGGPGAFIGAVHRIAAELDGKIEMVAGAFSSLPGKIARCGRFVRIDPDERICELRRDARTEKRREDGIDFVVIATPEQPAPAHGKGGAGGRHSRGQRQACDGDL